MRGQQRPTGVNRSQEGPTEVNRSQEEWSFFVNAARRFLLEGVSFDPLPH